MWSRAGYRNECYAGWSTPGSRPEYEVSQMASVTVIACLYMVLLADLCYMYSVNRDVCPILPSLVSIPPSWCRELKSSPNVLSPPPSRSTVRVVYGAERYESVNCYQLLSIFPANQSVIIREAFQFGPFAPQPHHLQPRSDHQSTPHDRSRVQCPFLNTLAPPK